MPKYTTICLSREKRDIGNPIYDWQANDSGLTKEYQIMLITTNRAPNIGNITIADYPPTSRTGNKCADNPVNYRLFQLESNRAISDHLKKIQFHKNINDRRKLNVYRSVPIHLNPKLKR